MLTPLTLFLMSFIRIVKINEKFKITEEGELVILTAAFS